MATWVKSYTVIAICLTIVIVAAIAAFVISVKVGVDPDVMFRFIAGPTIGNLLSGAVLAYGAIMNIKVNKLQASVKQVESQTNGHMTNLIGKIPDRQEMARIIDEREYHGGELVRNPRTRRTSTGSKPVPKRTGHRKKPASRNKRPTQRGDIQQREQ